MKFKPHHTSISVRNLNNSLKFYKTFGYEQVHRYDEPDGTMSIVHLKLGDCYLEIFAYKKNETEDPVNYEYGNNLENIGVKHIALEVADIEKALSDLKELGIADSSTQITFGRTKVSYFFVRDPDGVWVEIVKDDRY